MKKVILLIAITAIVSITNSDAQQLQSRVARHDRAASVKDREPLTAASGEKWYTTPEGFTAKYTINDIRYRVDYDESGHWLRTIRTYAENKLPSHVVRLVKAAYPKYDISLVEEIEKPHDILTYIIHLEGKTSWINLRVCNDELDEWQKFNKSANH